MAESVLTRTRITAGIWEGLLDIDPPDEPPPQLELIHLDAVLASLSATPDESRPGRFHVAAPIPAEAIGDGVQTFVIRNGETGERMESFAIVTGEPLEDDIRAEVELLRAELDMLKKAFRRHCLETT